MPVVCDSVRDTRDCIFVSVFATTFTVGVRHPLYSGAFLILWANALSPLQLWTAIWGSFYLIVGTYFEERKLISVYGDAYRQYQKNVSRYFPRW